MNMLYKIDKTAVATKNLASELTSAEISTPCLFDSIRQTRSPNLNGYSIFVVVVLLPFDTDTVASKFIVVYNAHIAKICKWSKILFIN